jgi:hypothetical protein
LPGITITPQNNQYENEPAMRHLVEARKKYRGFADVSQTNSAHHKNKQGPQNGEPVIFSHRGHLYADQRLVGFGR